MPAIGGDEDRAMTADRPAATIAPRKKGMGRKRIDLGELEDVQILNEHGVVDEASEPTIDGTDLFRIYRTMVLTRAVDRRMVNMQRQGEMGTFAPGEGQEATQIGQIFPVTDKDWFSPSYRSFGAQLWRGWTIEGLLLLWGGYFEGFEVPAGVNDLPFSIVVGSHILPAVGVAMAIRMRGDDAIVLTNFGDGALSQGVVSEAFNFAAVYKAPIVFVCENNGYAISTPIEHQAGTIELARRGPGFGIPSVRVDGNDVLAMIVTTRAALERARSGGGPSLIEAVTYRMSAHTTADDPKVYRSEEEVAKWRARCPIARFEKYLLNKGLLDHKTIDRIGKECEQEVRAARERFRKRAKARPREVFDFMFQKLPAELEAQKREYLARLDRKGVE